MITWRRALTLLSVAFLAALFAALVVRLTQSDSGTGFASAVRAGDKPVAPAFEAAVLWPDAETWPARLRAAVARGKLKLSDLRGYPAVLNFWASWCTACGSEEKRLARAARAYEGRVVFVGLDVHDLRSDARTFLEHHHADYVSLRASSVYGAYGLIGLPETYYLDKNGRAVAQTIGELTQQKLAAGIARARRD